MTCTTCGATIDVDDLTCPVCSAPVERPVSPPSTDAGSWQDPETSGDAGSWQDPQTPAGAGWQQAPPPPPTFGAPGSYATPPHPSGLSSEVRGWGIASHLAGLGGALVTIVTLGFLGPLLVWLVKRDDHPFIDHHAKEALNFQLTTLVALVAAIAAAVPVAVLGLFTLGVLWLVAGIVVLAASIAWFVFPILGAVRAANGEGFRYPVSIRFVK